MTTRRNIRSKLGLTQLQLAERLDISRSLVECYELGIRKLPTHAFMKLCRLEIMLARFEAETQSAHKAEQPLLQLKHMISGCDLITSMMTDDLPGSLKHISILQNTKTALAVLGLKQEALKRQLCLLEYILKKEAGIETEQDTMWIDVIRQHKLRRLAINVQLQLGLTGRIYKLQMKYG